MPLARKGSKSAGNRMASALPSVWNPAKDPIDRNARPALSKAQVAKGGTIKLDGEIVSLVTPKTRNKADATAAKRARRK
jgi:hypothetical protein